MGLCIGETTNSSRENREDERENREEEIVTSKNTQKKDR
jgi:hypothetical protein